MATQVAMPPLPCLISHDCCKQQPDGFYDADVRHRCQWQGRSYLFAGDWSHALAYLQSL